MIQVKPKFLTPQNELFPIFNVGNFYSNNEHVVVSQLLEYGNLYSKNIYYYMNSFMNGIQFEISINGITKEVFSLVAYLPNIIFEMSNVSYDENTDSTNITGKTYFNDTSIENNCNIGSNLNTTNILSHNLTSDKISVNTLSCRNLSINGQNYNETVGFIYLNGVSLPIQKSNLLSNFNITPITSFYFTLKQKYRLDIINNNNVVLYSYTNMSDDFIYYQQIAYNINMYKLNLYNLMNILL